MLPSSKLVQSVALPPLVTIEYDQPDDAITDIPSSVWAELEQSGLAAKLFPGMRIAVAVGSRGVAGIPVLVGTVVRWFAEKAAKPFIVPAMGSHGRATAEGQKELLAGLGITEQSCNCPIISSMDVVTLGHLDNGFAVYMDKAAYEADAVFVINRVKPHTSFRGPHESGLVKMITIGLGKRAGADSCHALGYEAFPDLLPRMARVSLASANILGGLAVVENSLDKTCLIEVVPARAILERDAALLRVAAAKMPTIPFDRLDVLVVDEMGKNISGGGMDYNVIGRYFTEGMTGGPKITKLGVLDITEESHGNGIGMGVADFITHRLRDKLDFEAAYVNALTATVSRSCSMPLAMATDRDLFKAAVKTCYVPDTDKIRLARIQNTLKLRFMQISPALLPEALEKGCRPLGDPAPIPFSDAGDLLSRGKWPS